MLISRLCRIVASQARFPALACAVLILGAPDVGAQVVDLQTFPIDRRGDELSDLFQQGRGEIGSIQLTQAQVPQPPGALPSGALPSGTPPLGAQPLPAQPSPLQAAPMQTPQAQTPPAPIQDPAQPQDFNQLNVDPNANINDLIQPQAPLPPAGGQNLNAGRAQGLGATAGSYSSAPNMIGDIFGTGLSSFGGSQTVSFSGYAAGVITSGAPGSATSDLAFEFGTDTVPNDIFNDPPGFDLAGGDGAADTFAIREPLPPNDALTSPGPGFVFDGGTAVYTNNQTSTTAQPGIYQDGQDWFISYSYTQTLGGSQENGRPLPGPGVAARRVKISENFSPEVRDRFFTSYNFFNDALGGLGDISRYTFGLERILVDNLISLEARLPTAGTYASTQDLDLRAARDFEFGNAALILKGVLLRNEHFIWSGGLGVGLPTADDTRIRSGGQEVLRVENETVHLLPFTALLLRMSRDTAVQAYMQLDVAANGDPVYADLTGGPLPQIGVFNDSTLIYLDAAVSHVIYRDPCSRFLQQVLATGELHYSGTMQESDFVQSGNLNYTNLKRHFNVVNATFGMHMVLKNNLVLTPAMSIPLRDGLDEQFDYEAIVHLNYLR